MKTSYQSLARLARGLACVTAVLACTHLAMALDRVTLNDGRVVEGEIYDVCVDIRRSSKTFGQWVGVTLSSENKRSLWVPPGFAHGFLVLSDVAAFEYKCTDFYAKAHERTLLWNDPALGIDWPIPAGFEPLIADKDRDGDVLLKADVFP